MTVATPLTTLALRRRHACRRDRLRFGAPLKMLRARRGETTFWFAPGAVFCVVLWRRNAYGTVSWRLLIARAGRPGDTVARVPGVSPGAHVLAFFRGVERVRRALRALAALERGGVRLAEVSPAYWRRFHVRVGQKRTLAPPSDAALQCTRTRRAALA